ncbi:MAG: Do family serine endopeptidase [Acidobacteriia bacterium]|nr:Do family serine endopeptidase [Terriglobia bacterium]
MKTWIANRWNKLAARPLITSVIVLAVLASLGGYEFVRPADVHAATAAPAAAPLDQESVNAILALDKAMETLAAHVTPAVVNVSVTSRGNAQLTGGDDDAQMPQIPNLPPGFGQFFGPQFRQFRQRPQIEHGIGSGVIISPDGYIVTNNHVVEGAQDIRVTISDRRVLPAKLIGADPLTDVAVIKISGSNFASIPWGDSTQLHPGQTVLAFGNPLGFRFSVTRGIVSAVNRPNPFAGDARKPGEFIQTDAAINQGNSGGPLVNARGQVVGINTFLVSQTGGFAGMGFAIPTQVARPTVETLIKDGKVSHGYMGIGISDVTPDNAGFFHRSQATGAVVTQVEPDMPAAQAGLRIGDVITEVDGQKVEDAGQLQVLIGQKSPGSKVNLQVERDGKNMTLPVTLEEMTRRESAHSASGQEHGKARWGLGLTDLNSDARQQLDLSNGVKGALVARVEPGSPADNAGMSQGDVILEVNRKETSTAADVSQALGTIPDGEDALLLVRSNGGNSFRVLHPAERPAS